MARKSKNPLRSRADRKDAIPLYAYCKKWVKMRYVSRRLNLPQILENVYCLRNRETVSTRTVVALRHLSAAVKHLEDRVEWIRLNIVEPARKGYGDQGYRRE